MWNSNRIRARWWRENQAALQEWRVFRHNEGSMPPACDGSEKSRRQAKNATTPQQGVRCGAQQRHAAAHVLPNSPFVLPFSTVPCQARQAQATTASLVAYIPPSCPAYQRPPCSRRCYAAMPEKSRKRRSMWFYIPVRAVHGMEGSTRNHSAEECGRCRTITSNPFLSARSALQHERRRSGGRPARRGCAAGGRRAAMRRYAVYGEQA